CQVPRRDIGDYRPTEARHPLAEERQRKNRGHGQVAAHRIGQNNCGCAEQSTYDWELACEVDRSGSPEYRVRRPAANEDSGRRGEIWQCCEPTGRVRVYVAVFREVAGEPGQEEDEGRVSAELTKARSPDSSRTKEAPKLVPTDRRAAVAMQSAAGRVAVQQPPCRAESHAHCTDYKKQCPPTVAIGNPEQQGA